MVWSEPTKPRLTFKGPDEDIKTRGLSCGRLVVVTDFTVMLMKGQTHEVALTHTCLVSFFQDQFDLTSSAAVPQELAINYWADTT